MPCNVLLPSLPDAYPATIPTAHGRPAADGPPKCRRSDAHAAIALPPTSIQNGVLQKTDQESLGQGRSRVLFRPGRYDRRLQHRVRIRIPSFIPLGNVGLRRQERFDSLAWFRGLRG